MNRVVPSSISDHVKREKIDIDDEDEEEENLNNNNIAFDGSSRRANELLNGLIKDTIMTGKGDEGNDETDGLSLECISSSSRKPSFIVHATDADDDSTSPTPLIMSANNVEHGIPAIEYSQHSYSNTNVQIHHENASSSTTSTSSSSQSCSWLRRVLGLNRSRNIDKRLASSYTSFHVGRFLAIAGSLTLLGGLFLKFLMLHDEKFWSIITWFAASSGLVIIFIGAVLVLWAALVKAQQARKEFEDKLHNNKISGLTPSGNKLRPESALSSSSFQSNNSRIPILGANHLTSGPSPIPIPTVGLGQTESEQSPTGHANTNPPVAEIGSHSSGNDLCVINLSSPQPASGKEVTHTSSSPNAQLADTSKNNPTFNSTWETY